MASTEQDVKVGQVWETRGFKFRFKVLEPVGDEWRVECLGEPLTEGASDPGGTVTNAFFRNLRLIEDAPTSGGPGGE